MMRDQTQSHDWHHRACDDYEHSVRASDQKADFDGGQESGPWNP